MDIKSIKNYACILITKINQKSHNDHIKCVIKIRDVAKVKIGNNWNVGKVNCKCNLRRPRCWS